MKKFLPYILILIILTELFGPMAQVRAQEPEGNCIVTFNSASPIRIVKHPALPGDKENNCNRFEDPTNNVTAAWVAGSAVSEPTPPTPGEVEAANGKSAGSEFENNLEACGIWGSSEIIGCFVQLSYHFFFVLPSAILYITGYLFNATLGITLSSEMYTTAASFLSEAWGIVRDFSNILFIFILLYVAIKMILDLGGSEAKKTIVNVIIIALLINFSMFFTRMVIDASNILALIFYNQVTVTHTSDGKTPGFTATFDNKKTGVEEKDFAGAIVKAFNPASFIDTSKFIPEGSKAGTKIPNGIALAIIFVSCAIFLAASWAFIVAGFAFLGRLIELWMLIIFSPFAFLSFAVPSLKGVDYLGWNSWVKRLMTVGFMAPLFMFFLLIISKITTGGKNGTGLFAGLTNDAGAKVTGSDLIINIKFLLLIIMPATIVVTMVLKATAFAKQGAGELGEKVVKYGSAAAGAVGGIALGAATGGVGMVLSGTLGRAGSAIANSGALKATEAKGGIAGFGAAKLRDFGKFAGAASYDARGAKIGGKTLASATGINLGEAGKGYAENRKIKDEKRRKRAEDLKVGEDEALKRRQNAVEESHQDLLEQDGNAHHIQLLDNAIKNALQTRANEATARARTNGDSAIAPSGKTYKEEAEEAQNALRDAQGERLAIKNASVFVKSDGTMVDHTANTTNGEMSEQAIKDLAKILDPSRQAKAQEGQIKAIFNHDDALKALNVAKDSGNASATELATLAKAEADAEKHLDNASKALKNIEDNADKVRSKVGVAGEATINAREKSIKDRDDAIKKSNADPKNIALAHAAEAEKVKVDALGMGRSINDLEDKYIPEAHHAVEYASKKRQRNYAESLTTPNILKRVFVMPIIGDSMAARTATAHSIRMGAKLDSGTGGKGGGH